MKIGISNFQSLRKVSLEFKGFAVLTGESNLGKSALVRAVGGLVFGIPGEYYIRRKAPSAAVGVRFDDTLLVKWQKVAAAKKVPGLETAIEINGVKHTKLGKEHCKLMEPLGFLSISTAAGDIRPQVAGQFDKAFLLDVSETVVAEVFKTLGRGDVITSARDAARKDLAKVKSELKVRDSDLVSAKSEVTKRAWVRPFRLGVDAVLAEIIALQPKEDYLGKVASHLAEGVPKQVPSIPQVPDLSDRIHLLKGIERYREVLIPGIPSVSGFEGLALTSKIQTLFGEIESVEADQVKVTAELVAARIALADLEKELGVCPACGAAFVGDTCGL